MTEFPKGPVFNQKIENGQSFMDKYVVYNNLFTPEECDQLIRLSEKLGMTQSVVGTENAKVVQKIRRSKVAWIPKHEEYAWIYQRISDAMSEANERMYWFYLTGFREQIQISLYDAEEEGHYGFHMDCGSGFGAKRKLSMSVQLSGPDDYEGGDMQFLIVNEPETLTKAKGTGVVFPAFMEHRVLPVTKGKRYSLVIWIAGPPLQ